MGIFKQISLIILFALGLGFWPLEVRGVEPASGKAAPDFLVVSGDDQRLSLDMLRGRVVVLFYESRHALEKNFPLKKELTRIYQAQPASLRRDVFPLVVIDCSEASRTTAPIWKSKLTQSSRREGFTIYGDWDRKMSTDYRMKPADSNFLIIDQEGIVRYAASGKVDPQHFTPITELIFALIRKG